ncbi:MAG: flagellar biosynthesis protein FliR [Fretibacterium sp.]|nr:flagellar biosynthesis protein FliR [Fretibacterium sp.]
MPQSNVYALLGLFSFGAALLVARLVVRIQKGELPGGDLWVLYLRILLGFLFAAAIVYGFRAFSA